MISRFKLRDMIGKILAVLIIAALLLPFADIGGARAAETDGVVTAHELYVRTGPGTEYENVLVGGVKAVLKENQVITILGSENGWYHLRAVIDGELVEGYSMSGKDGVLYISVGDEGAVSDNGDGGKSDDKNDDKSGSGDGKSDDRNDPDSGKSDDRNEDKSGSGDGKSEDENNSDSGKSDDRNEDKSGSDGEKNDEKEFDPTDLSDGVPEGYELKKLSWSAKFNFIGRVSAQTGLNMRKAAKTGADVIAVLDYDQEVVIIKTTIVTTKDGDGKSVKNRWYRVIANTGGKYEAGYVLGNYITIDCGEGIEAKTRYSKQVLRSKPKDNAKRVRNAAGDAVRLDKKEKVTITDDVVGTDGLRYFLIKVIVDETEYTGYIPALRLSFVSNTSSYSVNILSEKEPEAKTDKQKADDPAPPKAQFDEANAVIKGSAGLAVNLEARSTAERLFTEEKKLILLYDGESVQVLDTVNDGELNWCHIRFYYDSKEYFGYVRSVYVESTGSIILDDGKSQTSATVLDFEAKLEKEGFPESYKVLLRQIHEQYPAWEFRAFHTGLEWEEAVFAEGEVGINLIPNSYSVEWKSLATGAYSWKTDTFTVFDGSSWVTASLDAIRYYMDPRNFLTPERIFQFEILTYSPQFQDKAGLVNILKNTALADTSYEYTDASGNTHSISYEDTFLMAAEYTGVSPFHLASRVKQEVTIGASALSNSVTGTVEGYEGLYNYYNIGAYHSTVAGGAIRNGLKFASSGSSNANVLIPWSDPFRAILGGAYYIGNNYINRGQNTIYLQKFNATTANTYAHQYMANVEAPYSEGVRVFKGYVDLEEVPVVFSIPVYLNMPEEACPRPEKQYNPNNWLKTLKVYNAGGDKLALTPTFDYTKDQEYSLIVDNATDSLKIKATTVSSLSKVISEKTVQPEVGLNRIVVQVEAENGDIREYVINVIREEAPQEDTDKKNDQDGKTGDNGQDPETTGDNGQSTETTADNGQSQENAGDSEQDSETAGDNGQSPENAGDSEQNSETAGDNGQNPETASPEPPDDTGQSTESGL